jgi:hypothetical protein
MTRYEMERYESLLPGETLEYALFFTFIQSTSHTYNSPAPPAAPSLIGTKLLDGRAVSVRLSGEPHATRTPSTAEGACKILFFGHD